MRFAWVPGLAAIALLAAACAGGGSAPRAERDARPAGPATEVVVDEHDDGRAVVLAQGQTITVALRDDPATDYYSWTAEPIGSAVLTPICSASHTHATTAAAATGESLTNHFSFSASRPGTVELNLSYRRVFALDTPPAKTFRVTVTVN